MTEEEIMTKIVEVTCERLGVQADEVKVESAFVEDLGADSLDRVELVMALEDEFDIEIPDDEAEKLVKVSDALDYVKSKV